jgi:heme A synthase
MRFKSSPWLHRYAILVALCALVAIATGAIVTSLVRPIAATPAASINPAFEFWHSIIGSAALVFMLGLVIGIRSQLGWIGFSAAVLGAALHQFAPILHAVLAQIFFGAVVGVALTTSASWKRGPEPIEDSWRPSLRSLALAIPAIVLLQTTLGASYRYRALGVIWHILNAMLVLLLILIVAVFLIRQFPQHPTLRPTAVAVAVITSIQVLLGFTTFLMLILFPETSLAVVISSVLHVSTGALTFGASVALALQIRFNAQGPPVTHRSVTAT